MSAPKGQIPVVLHSRAPKMRPANNSSPVTSNAGPRTSTPRPVQSGLPLPPPHPGPGVSTGAPIQSLFNAPPPSSFMPPFPGQPGLIATAPVLSWGTGALVPAVSTQAGTQMLIPAVSRPKGDVSMQPGILGMCPGAVPGPPSAPFPPNLPPGLSHPVWPPGVMPPIGPPPGFPPPQSSSQLGTGAGNQTAGPGGGVSGPPGTNIQQERRHHRDGTRDRQSHMTHRESRHHGKRKEHNLHSNEDGELPRKRRKSGSGHRGRHQNKRGTILLEEGEYSGTDSDRGQEAYNEPPECHTRVSARGTVYRDDRNSPASDISDYRKPVNQKYESRRGTILMEDRDSPVAGSGGYQRENVKDVNISRRETIPREERGFMKVKNICANRKGTSINESSRGTILLEDSSDKLRPLQKVRKMCANQKGTSMKESSRGTLLLEDRSDKLRQDRDTILVDDRDDFGVGGYKQNTKDIRKSHMGTILREDRDPSVSDIGGYQQNMSNSNKSRRGTILRDDRDELRQGSISRDDRASSVVSRSHSGAILRDDRNEEYDGDRRRTPTILMDDRDDVCNDNRSSRGTILRDDREVGSVSDNRNRTGTVLMDDRDDGFVGKGKRSPRGTILRDDRAELDYASDSSRSSAKIQPEHRNKTGQGQRRTILRDDRDEGFQSQRTIVRNDEDLQSQQTILRRDDRTGQSQGTIVRDDRDEGGKGKKDGKDGKRETRNGAPGWNRPRGVTGQSETGLQENPTAGKSAGAASGAIKGDSRGPSKQGSIQGDSQGSSKQGSAKGDSQGSSKQGSAKGDSQGPSKQGSAKGDSHGSSKQGSASQETSKQDLIKGASPRTSKSVPSNVDGHSEGHTESWDARDYAVPESKDDRPRNKGSRKVNVAGRGESLSNPSTHRDDVGYARSIRGQSRDDRDSYKGSVKNSRAGSTSSNYPGDSRARDSSRDRRGQSSYYGERDRDSRQGNTGSHSHSVDRGYRSDSAGSVGSRDSPVLDFDSMSDVEEGEWVDLSDKEKAKIQDRWKVDSKEKPQIYHKPLGEAERSAKKLDPIVDPNAPWLRCSLADPYFQRELKTGIMRATDKMKALEDKFFDKIGLRADRARMKLPRCEERPKKVYLHFGDSDDSSSSSDSDSGQEEEWMEEMRRKQRHPHRLHPELWGNDKGELNVGPLCRCSIKSQAVGVRHCKFRGEKPIPKCDMETNNRDRLQHYRISISPVTNFLMKNPTTIYFDKHEYMFEGFSIFTHKKIAKLPPCQIVRFNIVYTIHVVDEPAPENFSVRSLDLVTRFLYDDILELLDIDWYGPRDENSCRRFHLMPRFARICPENGKELLSMNDVLVYFLKSAKPVVSAADLPRLLKMTSQEWLAYVDGFRGSVVTCPGRKPSSVRVDQLDKSTSQDSKSKYPLIIHHGWRPAQLSYVGDPAYKKKWREYNKFRHLISGWTTDNQKNRTKLEEMEYELTQLRLQSSTKREVTVELDSRDFIHTGLRTDVFQHAMLLPVLFEHLRFHASLAVLQKRLGWFFRDKSLLQLALTHGSYKVNYGTNPDHSRNSLTNCGNRQVEFGDFKPAARTRKRGLNVLLRVMSQMGQKHEIKSEIPHNERLEFLGDAVVEFITSIHLYFMLPYMNEGELTIYRGALVQNQHLCVLAKRLGLDQFMLYAHGPDLCHEYYLKHAMANCFEAILGALYMDGGLRAADRLMSKVLFGERDLRDIWKQIPEHPLQQDEPMGDRHWVENSPALKKLVEFEEMVGLEFRHVRLLARAFTMRNIGYNHLTLGHNQRLEFLGDTIVNIIASDYLFKHFPDHHEGHLTLLRSSLVNNRTQAQVSEELGLPEYVINTDNVALSTYALKQKDKADLLESFVGALFVDSGLEYCIALCEVCFFPRLMEFILNQDWNDPKSQLQQCCLMLRNMGDDLPDIPIYKVIHQGGPTNTRRYKVAVYFRGQRLAVGEAHNIQRAEMKAAAQALHDKGDKFQMPMSHRMRQMMNKNQALWEKEHGPLAPKSIWSSYSKDGANRKDKE